MILTLSQKVTERLRKYGWMTVREHVEIVRGHVKSYGIVAHALLEQDRKFQACEKENERLKKELDLWQDKK